MKEIDGDFLKGPIFKNLVKFSIPVLLALILQALYGAVDLWAVGKFATRADVSAVATGSQAMQIIIGLVSGLSMGSTVLMALYVGGENREGILKIIINSFFLMGILALLLTLLTPISAGLIAKATKAPEEAFIQTVSYIRICGLGSIFIVAYNLISAIFRGFGDSRSPLYFVIIACFVNILGDIILIKFFNMGASGAAYATVFAQGVSVVMSLVLMWKNKNLFDFEKASLQIDSKIIKRILKLGSPLALQSMCNEMSYLIILGIVNSLGEIASAGVGIAEKLVMFILLIPISYTQSISAFVGQNYGAGNLARAKKSMWIGMATAAVLGGIISIFAFFYGKELSTLFIKIEDYDVIKASAEFLKATSIECFILSLAYCFTGYFNGIGETNFVMIQGLISIFLVKIPYAYYAGTRPEPSLFQIGMSTVWAAAFSFAFCAFYYFYKDIPAKSYKS
ncbi:MATE family efflux transporter [Peptoniphilus catoniae]|uniref:MATE family efflux transporter n=1 Tax=Peptoniphilus catoniae TaxID=1660341 RepID=UPI0010FDBF83|nr:MATE family efflux transporter [Peptoniphilus catoniae]